MLIIWVLVAVLVLMLLWTVAIFNSLIKQRNRMKNAFSDIDVQLKRRYDLIPNLVETVKNYKNYEADTLDKVTKAREGVMNAQNSGTGERAVAENNLSSALKNLFAVAEGYPELMASEGFRNLQLELSSLENDIQSARRYYNASVRELNNATQAFPSNAVAAIFGFKQSEFFGAEEVEKKSVTVSF